MDIQKLVGMIQNRDIQTNLFIFILCVSLIQFFDTKIILSVGLFIFIILNYEHIITTGKTDAIVKKEIKKHEITDDMYYNTKVHDILVEIKHYKKYNKVSYKDGVKYMRKFFKTIHILEKDALTKELYLNKYESKEKQLADTLKYESSQIKNYNQYFENALIYLKNGVNHFQSITISLPERSYIDGLKHGDYEELKLVNKLGNICKELYKECYTILLNISLDSLFFTLSFSIKLFKIFEIPAFLVLFIN
jgi:hypothetical protein